MTEDPLVLDTGILGCMTITSCTAILQQHVHKSLRHLFLVLLLKEQAKQAPLGVSYLRHP